MDMLSFCEFIFIIEILVNLHIKWLFTSIHGRVGKKIFIYDTCLINKKTINFENL